MKTIAWRGHSFSFTFSADSNTATLDLNFTIDASFQISAFLSDLHPEDCLFSLCGLEYGQKLSLANTIRKDDVEPVKKLFGRCINHKAPFIRYEAVRAFIWIIVRSSCNNFISELSTKSLMDAVENYLDEVRTKFLSSKCFVSS